MSRWFLLSIYMMVCWVQCSQEITINVSNISRKPWHVLYQSAADWSHYSCCSEQREHVFKCSFWTAVILCDMCAFWSEGEIWQEARKTLGIFQSKQKKRCFHYLFEWSRQTKCGGLFYTDMLNEVVQNTYYQLMFTVITHECNISSVVNKDKLVTLYTVIIVSSLLAIACMC